MIFGCGHHRSKSFKYNFFFFFFGPYELTKGAGTGRVPLPSVREDKMGLSLSCTYFHLLPRKILGVFTAVLWGLGCPCWLVLRFITLGLCDKGKGAKWKPPLVKVILKSCVCCCQKAEWASPACVDVLGIHMRHNRENLQGNKQKWKYSWKWWDYEWRFFHNLMLLCCFYNKISNALII